MKLPPGILAGSIVFTWLAAGCVSPPVDHYYWGNYEALLLKMYAEPGSVDPLAQIEKLTADLQRAESIGQPSPPGVYAHLGMMYALNGEVSKAEQAFHEERNLYPESAVFIDGMMERALANNGATNARTE